MRDLQEYFHQAASGEEKKLQIEENEGGDERQRESDGEERSEGTNDS